MRIKRSKRKTFTYAPSEARNIPRITKAGKTKGGKQMYLCHECGHRFVEDIGKPSYSNGMTFLLGECS